MTKPLPVKRFGRLQKWMKWYPWFYVGVGLAYVVCAVGFGKVDGFFVLMAAVYLVAGISLWAYYRWLGSHRRRHSAPSPVLADGEVVLWMDDVNDREARLGRCGGLTLTDRRLAFEPAEDRFDPAIGREWPIDDLRSVRVEPLQLADGDVSSNILVFGLGDAGPQRFEVFDAEAALAEITAKLAELRSPQS